MDKDTNTIKRIGDRVKKKIGFPLTIPGDDKGNNRGAEEKMKKLLAVCAVSFGMFLFFAKAGFSHCQMPCGIYDDQARFSEIKEDITTIEKAMNELTSLSKEDQKNYNQIVRWVNTKEAHADKIMETVSDYFLAQRIALPKEGDGDKAYWEKLVVLHKMIVFAMKTKQSTDLANVEKLKALLSDFQKMYFAK